MKQKVPASGLLGLPLRTVPRIRWMVLLGRHLHARPQVVADGAQLGVGCHLVICLWVVGIEIDVCVQSVHLCEVQSDGAGSYFRHLHVNR